METRGETSAGASSTVSGERNIIQTVNVESPKQSKSVSIIVPIAAALISGIGGAFATHQFTLLRAPERTVDQAETLLGLARGAVDVAKSTKATPELLSKLEEIESHSRALQANAQLLLSPRGGTSFQADFWLPLGKAAMLGGATSFGIAGQPAPNTVTISLNNTRFSLLAGSRAEYKSSAGKTCRITYFGASPDGKLHGFKTLCEV